jgi:hypothetical protein
MQCPWCDAPADILFTLSGEPWGYCYAHQYDHDQLMASLAVLRPGSRFTSEAFRRAFKAMVDRRRPVSRMVMTLETYAKMTGRDLEELRESVRRYREEDGDVVPVV